MPVSIVYDGEAMPFRFLPCVVTWITVTTGASACSEKPAPAEPPPDPLVAFAPCRDAEPKTEGHGTSCLCCHQGEFGVAGSVAHDSGVDMIFVTDRDGRTASMAPNGFDNFFRHRKLTPPIQATVVFMDGETRRMPEGAPHGSCNACHGETTALVGER
jgi:hypothetical protein